MIPEYKYQVKDYSIITPPFKEFIVAPLIRFVPWWIPANIITVLSNLCMYGALLIALHSQLDYRINLFLAAFLIFTYAVADHLDGMQAKRTKTSSALGEFFDHYLDAFNTGVMLMTTFVLFEITNPFLVTFFLVVNYIAHASVFYEQFKTKWLIFEKIGSLEAVLLTSLLLVINCIKPIHEIFVAKPLFDLKVIEMIFIASAFGTIGTLFKTLVRAKITELNFYLFTILLILIAFLGLQFFPDLSLGWTITLYGAYYIGCLQRGHLSDGKERRPDIVIPVILLVALFIPTIRESFYLSITIIALLLGYVTYTAVRTIHTLRKFWVWVNPVERSEK